MTAPLSDRLRRRITDSGPIAVSEFVEAALYDPVDGFYAGTGRAGRSGDYLTAPEVGPLFGAVLARALDAWWSQSARTRPFSVVEYGAGPGTLARAVISAAPTCLTEGALRWVMVELSDSQRALHPRHEFVSSVSEFPDDEIGASVVLANELLDNLPFDIVERTVDGWMEVVVDVGVGKEFVIRAGSKGADPGIAAPTGTLLPVQTAARRWVAEMHCRHPDARLVVFDYCASKAELVKRDGGWLRTFRLHEDNRPWLEDPGSCDITADLDLSTLQIDHEAASIQTQARFLQSHGIEELVEEGRVMWAAEAHAGGLAALAGRSRIREAETLLDPNGMGSFAVLEWIT